MATHVVLAHSYALLVVTLKDVSAYARHRCFLDLVPRRVLMLEIVRCAQIQHSLAISRRIAVCIVCGMMTIAVHLASAEKEEHRDNFALGRRGCSSPCFVVRGTISRL